MKKLSRTTRIWIVAIMIPILLYAAFAIYVWIAPEPEPEYLGFSDDLRVGDTWHEEGAFQIQVTDVIIGDIGEDGKRQCEAVLTVTNENTVAHKRSNSMFLYHFPKDSENAYRIIHGSFNLEKRLEKIEAEFEEYYENLADIMEVWFSISAKELGQNVRVNPIEETEISSFVVEKGETATFRYGFKISGAVKEVQLYFTVLASTNHDKQYHGYCDVYVEDGNL